MTLQKCQHHLSSLNVFAKKKKKKDPLKFKVFILASFSLLLYNLGRTLRGLEYLKHTASTKENIKRLQHIFIWHLICVEAPER